MTEATVYEEQNQCRHVNQQSCFNAYKTVYKTTQVCNPKKGTKNYILLQFVS